MPLEKNKIHILVVDDEQGMRDMLSLELNNQGYQVTTACNGHEALKYMHENTFDLIVTDLKMPQMDGMTLLEKIKNMKIEVEVIVATGHGTVETAVLAMKNGAYDFILKPYDLDQLNGTVEKALEKRRLKKTVESYEGSHAAFSKKISGLLDTQKGQTNGS